MSKTAAESAKPARNPEQLRRYSLIVTYTDAPGDSTGTVLNKIVRMTKPQAVRLKKRLRALFDEHGDGNDTWYRFRLTEMEPDREWSAKDLSEYADGFQLKNGLSGPEKHIGASKVELAAALNAAGVVGVLEPTEYPNSFNERLRYADGSQVPAAVALGLGCTRVAQSYDSPKMVVVEGAAGYRGRVAYREGEGWKPVD